MTRKHFQLLADEIGDALHEIDELGEVKGSHHLIVLAVERACKLSNPNFNVERFTNAVQVAREKAGSRI
tara:strand:- start:3213 stop:3419 length:207 start_codon:yes stop_codon:yes gene_type:complete